MAALTVSMHSKAVPIDLGVIDSQDGFITGYTEKPTLHYDVSMGIYVYEKRAVDLLPPGPSQFPDLVHLLLDAGELGARRRVWREFVDALEQVTKIRPA